MRVLITGHEGYIGSVLTEMLLDEGIEAVGCDPGFFATSLLGPAPREIPRLTRDVRDIRPEMLTGFDAVIHLAALSNDPLGNLDPALTKEINHSASVDLAVAAREVGVPRFLFSSSCSLYGGGGSGLLTETAPMRPVTAYGQSKVDAERGLATLNTDEFSVVSLRNATAYGFSPRLRSDIVVNDFVGMATTTGKIVLESDGSPWRPLVHVRDISRAFLAMLRAPHDTVNGQSFNIVPPGENYRVSEMAEAVVAAVPGAELQIGEGAGPDTRDYRVDGSKITSSLEWFSYEWTLEAGIAELVERFNEHRLGDGELKTRFRRLHVLGELISAEQVDHHLRWAS